MSELWVVCRHTRGGFGVWALEQVLKMNLDKAKRGVSLNEEWHPLAAEDDHGKALDRMRELKRDIRAARLKLAVDQGPGRPAIPYPAQESDLDGRVE